MKKQLMILSNIFLMVMLMNKEIKDSTSDLWRLVDQHKSLFEYYKQNKSMRTREEIKQRIEYIKKNKISQRNELESLMWVLGIVGDKNERP